MFFSLQAFCQLSSKGRTETRDETLYRRRRLTLIRVDQLNIFEFHFELRVRLLPNIVYVLEGNARMRTISKRCERFITGAPVDDIGCSVSVRARLIVK